MCRDKCFVAKSLLLWRQTRVCRDKTRLLSRLLLSGQNTCFCRDKNGTCGSSRQRYPPTSPGKETGVARLLFSEPDIREKKIKQYHTFCCVLGDVCSVQVLRKFWVHIVQVLKQKCSVSTQPIYKNTTTAVAYQ